MCDHTEECREFVFTAMGSPGRILLDAYGRAAEAAAAGMMAEIARIEDRYSRYLPDSTLSALNGVARDGGNAVLDDETAAIVDYAFSCHRSSGGLFDITAGCLRRAWPKDATALPDPQAVAALLPLVGMDKLDWQPPRLAFRVAGMELDFGGIGKEYAVDRAVEICRGHGLAGLVDLGGDIGVTGPRRDGSPWPVGIRSPGDGGTLPDVGLRIMGGAVATSGDYERFVSAGGRRYGHILDPRTGWPVGGLAAVTVLADTCLVAGSVATIAMLKGAEGPVWLGGLDIPHLWVDAEGRRGGHALPV